MPERDGDIGGNKLEASLNHSQRRDIEAQAEEITS
jgi:hypothetical protein